MPYGSLKMNVRETVLQRAKDYLNNKDYQLMLVQDSKIRKPQAEKTSMGRHMPLPKATV